MKHVNWPKYVFGYRKFSKYICNLIMENNLISAEEAKASDMMPENNQGKILIKY